MRKVLVAILVTLFSVSVLAQTAPTATVDPTPATNADNIYAVGISANPASSTVVGGFGVYAHLVTGGSYAVTLVDVAPLSVRPFSVATQVNEGVAQKVFTFHNVPVYVLAAAGGSFQGQNSGFAWTGGGAVTPTVKGHKLLLGLRFNKSAVSNGAGYELYPAIGYVF